MPISIPPQVLLAFTPRTQVGTKLFITSGASFFLLKGLGEFASGVIVGG